MTRLISFKGIHANKLSTFYFNPSEYYIDHVFLRKSSWFLRFMWCLGGNLHYFLLIFLFRAPNMKFRNYLPHDKHLQEGKLAPVDLPKFEDPIAPVQQPSDKIEVCSHEFWYTKYSSIFFPSHLLLLIPKYRILFWTLPQRNQTGIWGETCRRSLTSLRDGLRKHYMS